MSNINMGAEMVKAGYSPSYSTQPSRVLETKAFKDLLAEKISNDEVLNAQKGNLHAKTLHAVKVQNSLTEDHARTIAMKLGGEFAMFSPPTRFGKQAFFILPYYKIVDGALDKLYKLAGSYASEKLEVTARPLEGLTDAELHAKLTEARKRFSKD